MPVLHSSVLSYLRITCAHFEILRHPQFYTLLKNLRIENSRNEENLVPVFFKDEMIYTMKMIFLLLPE